MKSLSQTVSVLWHKLLNSFPKWCIPFTLSLTTYKNFPYFLFITTMNIDSLSIFSHSKCLSSNISLWTCFLYFLDCRLCGSSFRPLIYHLYIFFCKKLVKSFAHFQKIGLLLFSLKSCKNFICIYFGYKPFIKYIYYRYPSTSLSMDCILIS